MSHQANHHIMVTNTIKKAMTLQMPQLVRLKDLSAMSRKEVSKYTYFYLANIRNLNAYRFGLEARSNGRWDG